MTSGSPPPGGTYRGVVAHPVGRALFLSQSASSLGDWVGLAALLVMAYERSGSVLGSGALFAVQGGAALVGTLVAGPYLDRIDRRAGLIVVYLVGAAALVTPLLLGGVGPVLGAAAVVGLTRPLGAALRYATAGALVPSELLGGVVALQSSTGQVFAAVGLAAGGTTVVLVGPTVALAFDIGTFLVAAALVRDVPSGRSGSEGHPAFLDGFRAWLAEPSARAMVVLMVASASVGALPETVAPAVARDSSWLPLVLAGQSIGTAVGGFAFGARRSLESPRSLARLTGLAAVALVAGAVVVGWNVAALALVNVVFGVVFAYTVLAQTVFTRTVDAGRLGAATSSAITLVMASEGVGSLAVGALAATAGVHAAYLAAAGVLALTAVVALRQGRPGRDRVEPGLPAPPPGGGRGGRSGELESPRAAGGTVRGDV